MRDTTELLHYHFSFPGNKSFLNWRNKEKNHCYSPSIGDNKYSKAHYKY